MDGKGKRLDVHQPTKLYQFRKFDRNRYCRYMMDLVLRIQIKNLATLRRRRSLHLAEIIISLTLIFFLSCKQVETLSSNKVFFLSINKVNIFDTIEIKVLAGKSSIFNSDDTTLTFKVTLFEVRGGYSELFGKKFNIHDGYDSKRIKIITNGIVNRTLAYNDLYMYIPNNLDSLPTYKIQLSY